MALRKINNSDTMVEFRKKINDVIDKNTFDQVICTQEEFNALITSPTWLDAKSVCFVGNGGTLKFTKNDGKGIKIPQTVTQIIGINSATIDVNNFVYHEKTNRAALWYETLPQSIGNYWISGLKVSCFSDIGYSIGFSRCSKLTNCIGFGDSSAVSTGGAGLDDNMGIGFDECFRIINCHGSGVGHGNESYTLGRSNGYGYGFVSCKEIINCFGQGIGTGCGVGTGIGGMPYFGRGRGEGFRDCSQITNCSGKGNGYGASYSSLSKETGVGRGFYICNQITNCFGEGNGYGASVPTGYSYYNCSYLNACKQGDTPPTTAFLGGTNTKVDTATVVAN